MKKRKPLMKILTMVLAATLMLSMSMTAFAANCCEVEDDVTKCSHKSADECDMIDCPVHETKTRTTDTEDTNDDDADAADTESTDQKTDDTNKTPDDAETGEDEEDEAPQGCVCENDDCNCTECKMECDDCETCHGCKTGCGEQIKKAKAEAEKNKDDDDVDSAKAGEEEDTTVEEDTAGMSADVVKDETETVKTGEFNMIPIIIGLVVVAVGAGGAYVVYRKKQA